ncbi:hypothetical protein [Roseovarius tolerans]|nr:hypothetical protein [Roseovarius tolerans]
MTIEFLMRTNVSIIVPSPCILHSGTTGESILFDRDRASIEDDLTGLLKSHFGKHDPGISDWVDFIMDDAFPKAQDAHAPAKRRGGYRYYDFMGACPGH